MISREKRDTVIVLLHQGVPDRHIARDVGVHHVTVAKIRHQLGLPAQRSGRKSYPTLAEAFRARTQAAPDGHLAWTGGFSSEGVPVFMHDGRTYSAYRISFQSRTGREPVGQVRPGCGMPRCVEPAHVDDQAARERDRNAYGAIFGTGPEVTT